MTEAATHSLVVAVLGTGSSGNATVVSDGATTLLVDCGFSARETARRMQECGLDPRATASLLVTHEHGDHVRGVEVFARRFSVQVCATAGTARAAGLAEAVDDFSPVEPGVPIRIGSFEVTPFSTSHDCAQPVGFRIESDLGGCFGLMTDTGVFTAEAAEALADCDVLAIESNHDAVMLERGPYPRFLKTRIGSSRGHLANGQAADALEHVASDRLRHVIAMHRSAANNSAELVLFALRSRLEQLGLDTQVTAAEQHAPRGTGALGTLFPL